MTTIKAASEASIECCMCGDYGFSYELFQCKVCQFRSQHRYCSNLYPKAESYRICNWCLSQKEESKEKSQNSSNSSSSNKASGFDDYTSIKKIRDADNHIHACLKDQIATTLQSQQNRPIKKQRSLEGPPPPPPPPPPAPRRSLTNGVLEENLRRTRSAEISHRTGIKRPLIFRNKVRRYKLLDEVSS